MKQASASPGFSSGVAFFLLISCLCLGHPFFVAGQQATRLRENLHGVLSRVPLTPPLRSGSFRMRFSPDGRYLLAEDSAGVFVFSVEPLKFVTYIEAPKIYHASFTPDSQALRIVARDFRVATRNVEHLDQLDLKTLPIKVGCLSIAVSSNGVRLACFQFDFALRVFDLSTGEEIYKASPDKEFLSNTRAILPLDTNTIYAGPIGYIMVDSWEPLAAHGIRIVPLLFSPDGQELIVGSFHGGGSRINLQTRKKVNLPGAIKERLHSLTWLDGDRLLGLEKDKARTPRIFSLENGAAQSTLSFTANPFQVCSNSRYLLLHDNGTPGARAFDLQENRLLDLPENIGADVFDSTLALLIEDGELYLYHLGDKLPYRMVHVPLVGLPELRTAVLDPSLSLLALAVDGQGAIFSATLGGRIGNFPRFLAADISKMPSVFLTIPGGWQNPSKILKFDTSSGTSSPAASLSGEFLRSGGPVVFEYSFENPVGRGPIINLTGGAPPYKLRAINTDSGAEVWKRSFEREIPVPFPDPQGSRLVLGWRAQSEEAKEIANHFPAAKQIMKKAKLDEHDTFFEVLDASTGKSLGGVLVQVGSHASSFDAAFSEGDTLFLLKDGIRVSLFSLSDGSLKAKLVGDKPAANGVTNLLALNEGGGKLVLYDANTRAKLDQLLFPHEIAYARFSEDGKRLFVLTQLQTAVILDVSNARSASIPSTQPPADGN
jgi:WD40 repeat protein